MDQAVREAVEAQAALANIGIIAYSPLIMGHHIAGALSGKADHDYWMEYNDPLLRGACGLLILMNDGWQSSRGVRDEYRLFVNDEKPCLFLSYPLTAYNLQTLKITISQFATDAG